MPNSVVFVLKIYLVQRLAISAVGILAAVLFKLESVPRILLTPREAFPASDPVGALLLAPWQRWDGESYIGIAAAGYAQSPTYVNFQPLYPLLTGGLGRLLFGNYILAGLIVSNVSYIVALFFLYKLVERGWGDKAARTTCIWLAAFPTAFFFLMAYTESLYLVLLLAAFYFAQSRRWLIAILLGGLLCLTRLQGVVLVLPFLVLWWQEHSPRRHGDTEIFSTQRREDAEDLRFTIYDLRLFLRRFGNIGIKGYVTLIGIILMPVGWAVFQWGYLPGATGQNNLTNNLNDFWGIKVTWPGETVITAFVRPVAQLINLNGEDAIFVVYNLWYALLLVLVVATLWIGRKMIPLAYSVFAWATLLVLLTRVGTDKLTLISFERYILTLFPLFIIVGVGISGRHFKRAYYWRRNLLTLGILLQGMMAFGFTLWAWVG